MSGIIVLGIVAIWIVVLVPMWLNRHEADSASRSMDTFSTAMRVLSHRNPDRADRRYLVLPRDNFGVTVDNQPGLSPARPRRFFLPPIPMVLRLSRRHKLAPPMSGRARLVARRRKISVGFAVLTIGLAVSAVVFHTSWWFELGAGLALAGYVIHLRNEAIRVEQTRRRRSQRAAREAASRTSGHYYGSSRSDSVIDLGGSDSAMVGVVAAPASASGTENGSRWEPVAVPLPTYVSKPVVARTASATPRAVAESGTTIDLTRPGAWIDSQVDVRHLLLDESVTPPRPVEVDELDAILERRRAVND